MEKARYRKHRHCYRWLILGSLFLLIILRGGLLYVEDVYGEKVSRVTQFPSSSQVYDRDGELLYEFFGEVRRIPVSKKEIPKNLTYATLMAEDERFYEHSGFDPFGIVRAFYRNWKAGQIVEGASTLGQQLVKNTMLGPADGYAEKFEEVLMSMAVDLSMTKEEILHLYLNTIPYGSNVYGVEAASRYYLDKHADELSISESAMLAALPKHPSYLSPYAENVAQLKERRDWILSKMHHQGLISDIEYSTALSTPIEVKDPGTGIKAPHFVMHIREQLEEVLGAERVEQGGLIIKTTLDTSVQEKARQAIKEESATLERNRADSAGLFALKPDSGEILAMVGNTDYFKEGEAGNYNMTLARRQPGSAFKPLVYSALLEEPRVHPATILMDTKRDFSIGDEPYIPHNYDEQFRGPITVRSALAQSLNVPAVEALMRAGINDSLDTAEDLGISTLEQRQRFGPSVVLGGAEVTLVDLVSAYGTFANKGVQVDPKSILEIETIDGKKIDWTRSVPRQVIHEETAYQITSILSDNDARAPTFGYYSPLAFRERQVAAKTGTTQEYRDAWTVGYTPQIAAGVWVGNHDNTPLRYGAAGSIAAGPVWRAFMDKYLEHRPVETIEPPESMRPVRIRTALGPRTEYVAPWQMDPPRGAIVRGENVPTP